MKQSSVQVNYSGCRNFWLLSRSLQMMDDIGDLHLHFGESQVLFEGHRSMFDLLKEEGI